jgi:hypothetical protein
MQTLLIHVANEEPILAEVEELPALLTRGGATARKCTMSCRKCKRS